MPRSNSASRLSTSVTMRAFASGGKCRATYAAPIASPIALSVSCTARFQRGRNASVPRSVRELKSNEASTKAAGSTRA